MTDSLRPDATRPPALAVADPSDRAEEFIAAGYHLLEEDGLEGLSVRAVLRVTGYNRKSFYAHFSDKDQLVLAVFARTITLLTRQCSELVTQSADPYERIELIVRYIVMGGDPDAVSTSYLRRAAALCREHMRLAEAHPEQLRKALSPLIGLLADQLAAGMADNRVRREDPERLAELVYNLVSTTVHAATLAQVPGQPIQAERRRLASQIWEFCRRGIAP